MSESHSGNGEQSLGWLRRAVAFPYFWLLLFFLAPFLIILKISFADPIVAQPPFTALLEWSAEGFEGIRATFSNYAFLFQDGYYGIIYLASLKMAAIGTCSACCSATRWRTTSCASRRTAGTCCCSR